MCDKTNAKKEKQIFQTADGVYLDDACQPYPHNSKKYIPHVSTRYLNVILGREKTGKKLPELYAKRENCCGCTACYAVCPTKAIRMMPDEEGFLYPVVDASICIRCYKCLTACAFKEAQEEKGYL